jgi:hypothetical protein
MEGTDGGNSFVDQKNNVITRTGTPTISAANKVFGSTSAFFNGTSYLTAASSPNFGFGVGDFTIEGWFNCSNVGKANAAVVDFRASGGGSNQAKATIMVGGGSIGFMTSNVSTTKTISNNTWYHFAWSRVAGVSYFYIDGKLIGSRTDTADYGSTSDVVIGQVGDNRTFDGYFPGYIDEVRITRGVGRYVRNFAIPSTPFVELNPTDSNFANTSLLMKFESNNGSKIIGDARGVAGALTFTGTPTVSNANKLFGGGALKVVEADSITIPYDPAFYMPEDYTLECWLYPTARSTGTGTLMMKIANGTYPSYGCDLYNDGSFRAYFGTGANASTAGLGMINGPALVLNQWTHVAIQRRGGVS